MTTIAWDGHSLAADTLFNSGGQFAGFDAKIHRLGRLLIGCAGSVAVYEQFRDWVKGGMKGECPLKKDIANTFVVTPEGRAVMWCDDGPFRVSTTQWALGSGERYALGAMEMGATAAEAVAAAIRHDLASGGEVMVLRPAA
jgi:ATP-dependent protease HslVU (ClpYQ) peptidase subunit